MELIELIRPRAKIWGSPYQTCPRRVRPVAPRSTDRSGETLVWNDTRHVITCFSNCQKYAPPLGSHFAS